MALWLAPLPVLAAVASDAWSAGPEGPHPKAITIADQADGALLSVSLDGLPKGARVLRARLDVCRTAQIKPEDLLAEIAVHAGAAARGRPLPLAPPAFDSFDVTDAARRAAGGELQLFVKSFPGWHRERTRLEVAYEGAQAAPPPTVKGLKAVHRAGQTFLTWAEAEPLIAAEKATWGEYKRALADAKDPCSYRVYAHTRPITARNILDAELLGEAEPLSCWNASGRNMEYLIGQAMQKSDEMGELARDTGGYMYTWGPNHPRMDRYPLERFAIDEKAGQLPPGTGLYVVHPSKAGKRYYAVASSRGGVENLAELSAANSLAEPIEETVGVGEPVLQGPGLWGPFFDYPGRRQVYVQWCAPPLAPRPNMSFNWSVLVPPNLKEGEKAPGELYFHSGNFSYAKPRQKFMLRSVQLAPHDWPYSGWYGFNDAFGTLKSYRSGAVSNHTQRRIIAFLDWAKARLPLDPERIMLPGSDGAVMLALAYPDVFSYVMVNRFEEFALLEAKQPTLPLAWGPKSPDIKDAQGRADWGWAMLDELVLAQRGKDLPLIFCRGYSWGAFERAFARGEGRFYAAMRKANQPLLADWTWASGYLIKPDQYTGLWRGMDVTRTTPMPAFANCSTDKNTEGDGQTNLHMTWQPIKESPDAVEAVISSAHRDVMVDMAFRRLQSFKPKPGEKLAWEGLSAPLRDRRAKPLDPQGGTVAADKDGIIVLKGLKVGGGLALTVKVSRAK
ncbi:MAG: hypothetical protein FJ291_12655 [Planctomycetes bacterium]|nr:hypothetical protein [Planctomycetota bacterium]